MTRREKQSLFVRLLAQWITWVYAQGWALTLAEGYVGDSVPVGGRSPHRADGGHFKRLAQDMNLFVDSEWIQDGDHPAWQAAGEHWERLHSLCRWGGRFGDANHLSLIDAGVA